MKLLACAHLVASWLLLLSASLVSANELVPPEAVSGVPALPESRFQTNDTPLVAPIPEASSNDLPEFPFQAQTGIIQKVVTEANQALVAAGIIYEQMGHERFLAQVRRSELDLPSSLGQTDFRLFVEDNGQITPLIRIVDQESESAFIVLDSRFVNPNSRALYKFLSEQYHRSGTSRSDRKTGRDVFLLWHNGREFTNAEFKPKPHYGTPEFFRTYFRAFYERPDEAGHTFAMACVIFQGTSGLVASGIKRLCEADSNFSAAPAVLNVIYGYTLGYYSKTFVPWRRQGWPNKRIAKNAGISFSYAFFLTLWMGDGNWSTFSLMSLGHIMTNISINNILKADTDLWAKTLQRDNYFLDEHGQPKHLEIPDWQLQWRDQQQGIRPHLKYKPHRFDLEGVYFQWYAYLPVQFLRTLDLIGVTVAPGGVPIPLGTVAYWGSVPLVKYLLASWARRFHPRVDQELKISAHWESFKKDMRDLVLVAPAAYRVARATGKKSKQFWQAFSRWLSGAESARVQAIRAAEEEILDNLNDIQSQPLSCRKLLNRF